MLMFGNGTVLTFDQNSTVIEDGGVVIEGEEIIEVGKTAKLKEKYPQAEFKNVKGKVIMPGMINTHMHLYSTFARGMDLKADTPPQDFVDILEKLWWRLDQILNEKDIYYSALFALLDGIKKGTTTIFDHHASYGQIDGSLDIIADAVKETGLRANLSYEVSDRHGVEEAEKALDENERFIKKLARKDPYLGGTIGLHASFTLGDKILGKVASLSEQLQTPVHIHTAEGWADVADSQQKGFTGVVDRLNKYNIWRKDSLAIHGVHLQEGELDILKRNQINLIHNPESNMGNAVGTAPIKEALAQKLTVGLGTDGYTTDMFESINVANLLQSHEQSHPSVGGEEAFQMAFINNQKIAQNYFSPQLGVLEPGAAADLIVVDYQSPTPIKTDNAFGHILMGVNGGLVDSTIVGGRILMENREVKVLDDERIYWKCQEQARDFWQRF
ncbi:putative aminohydrolase SsnA [Sporohalobacter salinus]|uniref:putative aminohydrolase SsnA n=1 Tax=Sporohalobacter salinus TaxID=1494606 RepID=UPI001960D7E4|nr:putative aminohydrolase SsnA [Sporohalobacter salinus]MBM7622495.1 putative selenium metabolism protein SsnA [Sporohalobacter salinus]